MKQQNYSLPTPQRFFTIVARQLNLIESAKEISTDKDFYFCILQLFELVDNSRFSDFINAIIITAYGVSDKTHLS
jgi:hypothetical protein